MKTIIATVGAVMTAVTLGAQEADEKSAETEEEAEETVLFEYGIDIDFYSAYVWRNAVQNDRMVIQPSPWIDVTFYDCFWVGGNIWQNYDLTSRRRDVYSRALTETDYNVHVGYTAWCTEDEEYSLTFELGHDWYINQFLREGEWAANPSTREIYVKFDFANPLVGVYGQASWMYEDFGDYRNGMHYELGLKKEFVLVEDTLNLGFDWNVNFGDRRYLFYLYDGIYGEDAEGEETCDNPHGGIGGTTVKAYLSWSITDWVALKGTLAYTGLVDGEIRQAHGDAGDDNRDLLWGGFSLNFQF